MFTSRYAIVISLLFLTTGTAASQPFGYQCSANDKKIIAHYTKGDRGRYILNSFTIDGQDYKSNTRLSVARGSAEFFIENYRDGKRLRLKMGVENVYQLGEDGTVYQMLCYPIPYSGNQHSNDQL